MNGSKDFLTRENSLTRSSLAFDHGSKAPIYIYIYIIYNCFECATIGLNNTYCIDLYSDICDPKDLPKIHQQRPPQLLYLES